MTETIDTLLRAGAAAHPDKPLFERPGETPLSFRDAAETVDRLAGALEELNVGRGDRVAAQVEKSVEAVLLYLAALRIGAVFLPLNPAYTADEIGYFLADSDPALFVQAPGAAEPAVPVRTATLGTCGDGTLMDRARTAVPSVTPAPPSPDDAAAILYTSGTTGRSKGAVLTHRNLLSNALTLAEIWRFTPDDRLIHALPIFHVHGLFVACNTAIAAGATMVFHARFDPDAVVDAMADASVLMGVPTFYTRLLASPRLDRAATAGMRLFISGSAPLLAEHHTRFTERTGHAILERYGMTEAGMIASNPYEGERRAGAVGMALPGVAVRIADRESGSPLSPGEIGRVEVRGPNVFREYWRMPGKTAAEFTDDGFFVTGDLGRFDADGYLHIVGRDKDLVIAGGFNIYPKEIEEALDALPEIAESAVIGVPHPDLGEAVVAVVVPAEGAVVDEARIDERLGGTLARFKRPRRVIAVSALPRNVMGKVQKAELRARYAGLFASESGMQAPPATV